MKRAVAVLCCLVCLTLLAAQTDTPAPQPEPPPPAVTYAARNTPAYVEELVTVMFEPADTTEEPLPWNPETHANGYCEGYCWEGICPFFEGYPDIWHPRDAIPLEPDMQQYVYDACEAYGVDMALVLAIIERESSFRPQVWGDNNSCFGLMQINRVNYNWLRDEGIEPLEYPGNIQAGVLMISRLLDKYDDTHKALMAYNGGESYARRLWNQGIFTTKYSRAVTQRAEHWQTIIQQP